MKFVSHIIHISLRLTRKDVSKLFFSKLSENGLTKAMIMKSCSETQRNVLSAI